MKKTAPKKRAHASEKSLQLSSRNLGGFDTLMQAIESVQLGVTSVNDKMYVLRNDIQNVQSNVNTLERFMKDGLSAFDKKIDERFNFTANQISLVYARVGDLEDVVEAVNARVDKNHKVVMDGIDGLLKNYDTLTSEYLSMKEQGNRRQSWYIAVGKKAEVPYPEY